MIPRGLQLLYILANILHFVSVFASSIKNLLENKMYVPNKGLWLEYIIHQFSWHVRRWLTLLNEYCTLRRTLLNVYRGWWFWWYVASIGDKNNLPKLMSMRGNFLKISHLVPYVFVIANPIHVITIRLTDASAKGMNIVGFCFHTIVKDHPKLIYTTIYPKPLFSETGFATRVRFKPLKFKMGPRIEISDVKYKRRPDSCKGEGSTWIMKVGYQFPWPGPLNRFEGIDWSPWLKILMLC